MDYTFFGVQVVIKAFFGDPLRKRLHEVIASGEREQSVDDKRKFYKRLTGVLADALPYYEMGFWDLVRGGKAEDEFNTWVSEIEGAVATEGEEVAGEADEAARLSANKDYLIVTTLFLVQQGSNSDATLGRRCDFPESDYWTRMTFGELFKTIPMLSFSSIKADAVYLIPGSDEDGLSMEDLHVGGYEYLKPLS